MYAQYLQAKLFGERLRQRSMVVEDVARAGSRVNHQHWKAQISSLILAKTFLSTANHFDKKRKSCHRILSKYHFHTNPSLALIHKRGRVFVSLPISGT